MRVQTTQALSAKIFVEFIALIVRNRMYNLLKETMLRLETKPNYMTVPAALRELEKIEMVRRGNNGHYRLDHAVTKKQKTILSAFGLSDTDVKSIAVEIGNQLSGEQTPTDKAPEEDDDYARTRSLASIETEISKVTAELQKAQEKVDELTQRLLELQDRSSP